MYKGSNHVSNTRYDKRLPVVCIFFTNEKGKHIYQWVLTILILLFTISTIIYLKILYLFIYIIKYNLKRIKIKNNENALVYLDSNRLGTQFLDKQYLKKLFKVVESMEWSKSLSRSNVVFYTGWRWYSLSGGSRGCPVLRHQPTGCRSGESSSSQAASPSGQPSNDTRTWWPFTALTVATRIRNGTCECGFRVRPSLAAPI